MPIKNIANCMNTACCKVAKIEKQLGLVVVRPNVDADVVPNIICNKNMGQKITVLASRLTRIEKILEITNTSSRCSNQCTYVNSLLCRANAAQKKANLIPSPIEPPQ